MVVITDTTPLNYLILIDAIHVLGPLYGQVVIPIAVMRELQHADAPPQVLNWIAAAPEWLRIDDAETERSAGLEELGSGERAAILLAEAQTEEVLLLMDEIKGRAAARSRNLVLTGTLGVLDAAAEARLLDLPTAIARLRETSFHVTPVLLKRLLDKDAARHQKSRTS